VRLSPNKDYLALHRDLLAQEAWIIDGYGDTATAWERFGAADTLIHIDPRLPILLAGNKASGQRFLRGS
jgi:hypothetical protein